MADREINIPLDSIEEGLFLEIKARAPKSLFEVEDAEDFGEATFQIKEGHYYHYLFSLPSYYFQTDEIVDKDPFISYQGRISPNIYVDTLKIPIFHKKTVGKIGFVGLEVRSYKTKYREDYRFMLQ